MKTVFIIDSQKMSRDMTKMALEQVGMTCYTHDENRNFKFFIEDIKPSVITIHQSILDDGRDNFFKELKSCENLEQSKLIFIGDSRSEGIAFDYEIKLPFNPVELAKVIVNLA